MLSSFDAYLHAVSSDIPIPGPSLTRGSLGFAWKAFPIRLIEPRKMSTIKDCQMSSEPAFGIFCQNLQANRMHDEGEGFIESRDPLFSHAFSTCSLP